MYLQTTPPFGRADRLAGAEGQPIDRGFKRSTHGVFFRTPRSTASRPQGNSGQSVYLAGDLQTDIHLHDDGAYELVDTYQPTLSSGKSDKTSIIIIVESRI